MRCNFTMAVRWFFLLYKANNQDRWGVFKIFAENLKVRSRLRSDNMVVKDAFFKSLRPNLF